MAEPVETWAIPTPFPVGPVNAHRVGGARPALIDAGPQTPEAEASLRERLAARPVELLVVTHEHVDHCGLARVLQRDLGVRVLLHESDARVLERWDEDAEVRQADYDAGLRAAGVPPEHLERLRAGGRKYDRLGATVIPDGTFRGGDRLRLGDGEFEVVDAPGHTAGSYLLTDGHVTFSGDTLLERITPNALSVRASERGALVSYLETLRRLRGRDWGFVHPGHGRPFRGAHAVIERGLAHARERQERILGVLAAGPRSAYGVAQALFSDLPPGQVFLAVSEALGHLEYLRHHGRAATDRVDGVDRYRPT